jgi:hypothetical protein
MCVPHLLIVLCIALFLVSCTPAHSSAVSTLTAHAEPSAKAVAPPIAPAGTLVAPTGIVVPTPTYILPQTPTLPAQFPVQPESPDQQIRVITDFLNVSPTHVHLLSQLFAAWQARLQVGDYPSGDAIREIDIDGDTQPELLVIPPVQFAGSSDTGKYPGLLITFHHLANGMYQPFAIHTSAIGAIRIWQVIDVTQDGHVEILLQANDCGAHTCFMTLQVLQWAHTHYRQIFTTRMSYAEPRVQDIDGDGVQELLVTGGTVGSTGAGVQRAITEIYAWNGTTFALRQTIPDPIASQHPYWKLMDGNTAMKAKAYAQAILSFQDAIAAKPPYPSIGDQGIDAAVVVAAARFQLMLAYLELGEHAHALSTYQEAQQRDGKYATWTSVFWDRYQVRGDIAASCTAARTAAHDVYLPGYNYANHPLQASGALCER